MNPFRHTILAAGIFAACSLLASVAVQAQSAGDVATQRNVNQQQRIEQGLQSGQLTTTEAARLERDEAVSNKLQQRDLRDGKLSATERARLQTVQNRDSRAIKAQKHDAQVGNPDSASSQRLQHDVARNVHQQTRVRNGVQSGALTPHEAGRLEGREAHAERVQQLAARDGHVGVHEQRRITRTDNRDSRRIFRKKHNHRVG
jgi:hypothetical protein